MLVVNKLWHIIVRPDLCDGYWIDFEREDLSKHTYHISFLRMMQLNKSYSDRGIDKKLNQPFWKNLKKPSEEPEI